MRAGRDVTILCYSRMRYVVMQAVQQLEKMGYDPEVRCFPRKHGPRWCSRWPDGTSSDSSAPFLSCKPTLLSFTTLHVGPEEAGSLCWGRRACCLSHVRRKRMVVPAYCASVVWCPTGQREAAALRLADSWFALLLHMR